MLQDQIEITRRVRFSAARRLAVAGWDERRNQASWGEDSRLHGHDWALDVTVSGRVSEQTGMVLDLKRLKALLLERVTARLERRDISDSELLAGRVASDENLVVAVWNELHDALEPNVMLTAVTLWRGPDRRFCYRGE